MGSISGLSDELLIKILTFLPTKVAVSTSILSKQWEFLWMWLPKLEYSSICYSDSECERLRCFLDRNLPLHRASVIESFRLEYCDSQFKPEDIKLWVLTAVSRNVRELDISHINSSKEHIILPSSLYMCKFLVTLKLNGRILVDVPRMVCLPSLKTLRLEEVIYFSEVSLQRLLSNCPVLKDLFVVGCEGDNMGKVIAIVPSLQRLTLSMLNDLDEFVINTPSLKYLKLQYYNSNSHYCLIENMPKLREAYLDVCFDYIERLMGSITSVTRVKLCLVEDVYRDRFFFNQLEHLQLCTCQEHTSSVLVRLLKDSPNLRVLDLLVMEAHDHDGLCRWNQPSTVPECMLSSLQTFKWSGYLGRPEERDLAIYFLKNARRLKTARILSEPRLVPTVDMIKELALSSRASTACQLVFD